jgi:hypothetical protein
MGRKVLTAPTPSRHMKMMRPLPTLFSKTETVLTDFLEVPEEFPKKTEAHIEMFPNLITLLLKS